MTNNWGSDGYAYRLQKKLALAARESIYRWSSTGGGP